MADRMTRSGPDGAPTSTTLFRAAAGLVRRALSRLWGPDVMLYTGGVSFYALLAGFPGLAIVVSAYSLLFTPEQAAQHAQILAALLPPTAQDLVAEELQRLAHAPLTIVGAQGALAAGVGLYAAQRGVRALIAGLSFIHQDKASHGFVRVNLLALIVFLAGVALVVITSTVFVVVRVAATEIYPEAANKAGWLFSQWVWAGAGLALGLTLIYRYAMSDTRLGWRASAVGGTTAALLSLAASWGCAVYVDRVARLGATYGSIAAVVVCLIWISWNVNATFFGGALATEAEALLNRR